MPDCMAWDTQGDQNCTGQTTSLQVSVNLVSLSWKQCTKLETDINGDGDTWGCPSMQFLHCSGTRAEEAPPLTISYKWMLIPMSSLHLLSLISSTFAQCTIRYCTRLIALARIRLLVFTLTISITDKKNYQKVKNGNGTKQSLWLYVLEE